MPAPIYWPQGNTHTPLAIQLQTSAGQQLDLTGYSTIVLHLRPIMPNAASAPCIGAVTPQSPLTSGVVSCAFAAADVAATGYFYLGATVTYANGSVQTVYEQVFVVQQAT